MVTPSYLKILLPLQAFTSKSRIFSTSSPTKIKNLIHTLLVSHVPPAVQSLSKAKTILVELFWENQLVHLIYTTRSNKRKQKNMKIFLGSFRLHYNWCSSHVMPMPEPVLRGISGEPNSYVDPNWSSIVTNDRYEHVGNKEDSQEESQLSGYLYWLEEKVQVKSSSVNGGNNQDQANGKYNDIDQLADLFIKRCHEKFILEKQESYRKFQEMMARNK